MSKTEKNQASEAITIDPAEIKRMIGLVENIFSQINSVGETIGIAESNRDLQKRVGKLETDTATALKVLSAEVSSLKKLVHMATGGLVVLNIVMGIVLHFIK